jgi:mannose/fructose/N-acetylgalactosamine-specific phosphotransferase system component IIB
MYIQQTGKDIAMPVVLARIDERLIRGKTIGTWTLAYGVNVIIIVDDVLAANKVQLDIFALTTPPNVKLFAQSVDGFIEKYNKGVFENYKVMLIFRDTSAITKIAKSGLKLPVDFINIGSMKFKEGKVELTDTVSVSPSEIDNLLYLNELGYGIECRQMETYDPTNLVPMLKAHKTSK